ncbi:cupin domain-containing protein [bacterium]|nr:cupin domain-containing protein [Chloroflexi bacterium CFX6]RIL11526.1 MAG: cupin domain-containing protein [bacterium]
MPDSTRAAPGDAPAVRNLGGMLHVQEGAIVSRVLLKNAGGTVTLFAFDDGQGLSEHTTPYDALVVAVEGRAEIDVAGATHAVAAGETIVLPAGQPHAVRAVGPFKMVLTMLRAPA